MDIQRVEILNQIDRLAPDPEAKHSQAIPTLKRAYNQIVVAMYNGVSSTRRDILDSFPPEVWIQIVEDALPERGYSFALLLLTMVSKSWMNSLTSVPTLWATIDIRGSREDSLATFEVFRRLSCDAPVHLKLYAPTMYDQTTIFTLLMNIGPRIHEVTISPDTQHSNIHAVEETWPLLHALLTGSKFNPSLTYIHLEYSFPQVIPGIAQLAQNNYLPPSLRSIRGWNFEWGFFPTDSAYLKSVEAIESICTIEGVLSSRIELPALKSLKVDGYRPPSIELNSKDANGFPLLANLTSLTYHGTYRPIVMQLLLVASQLAHLDLKIPYAKIPLLGTGLQAAINLRRLNIGILEYADDEGGNKLDVCPVYQHIDGKTYGLSELSFEIVRGRTAFSPAQMELRSQFLSHFMSIFSALYTTVEILQINMITEHPIDTEEVLSYVASLPELKTLHLQGLPEYRMETMEMHTLRGVEYLNTYETDVSYCLYTPNIHSLSFTWGHQGRMDTFVYSDLRKLFVTTFGVGPPVVELLESKLPSLEELTLSFREFDNAGTYRHFKLPSFNLLRSITIDSSGYQPQATMLCFALLNNPSNCPALNEIRFTWHFPDWDILFLMLERRNFLVDSTVSLIRRITVPYIPNALRTPLSTLLGGVYAERPPNNELFMGGAQELLLDEQVPGCIDCLMLRMVNCKYPVGRGYQHSGPYRSNQYIRFALTDVAECGDPTIVDWTVKRQSLLAEFLVKLGKWGERHHRKAYCDITDTGMEITEHGVASTHHFS